MDKSRTAQPAHFLENLISRRQLAAIVARAKLVELAKIFATMHKVYEQDGKGDEAIVHSELGYISIAELIANGAELDLHWTPCTLGEALAGKAA